MKSKTIHPSALAYSTPEASHPKERNLNADLIRCIAVFSVISVHFLLNSGFYQEPVVGTPMFVMCIFRSFFMTCVPLFMILTGFLMCGKKLSKGYYRGILKTLEIYVLVSIACLLFKKFSLHQPVTFYSGFLDILSFKGANYSWYIEMYIGLFLLIPFLNLTYKGLSGRRQKRLLLVTMLTITFFPKLLNNFNLTELSWWLSPESSTDYNKLLPSFFTVMYPITYYFLGAYLREYGVSISFKKNLLFWILSFVLFGCYNFYRSGGGTFVWGANSTWGGENLITAFFLFMLLLRIPTKNCPPFLKKALVYLSSISLGIYLISWIFDQIVYVKLFKPLVPLISDRFVYYPLVALSVFLLSAAGASVIYFLRWLLHLKFFHKDNYGHFS